MRVMSEVIYVGPANIVQDDNAVEVTCRITVTQRVVEFSSAPVSGSLFWTGEFSCVSGSLDAAPGVPTSFRLPDGEKRAIALKHVTVDAFGATRGSFYGRGGPPGE